MVKVLDLMNSPVLTVHVEASLREAARMMLEARVSGLPVVDSTERLVGIITEADLLAVEVELENGGRRGGETSMVAEVMTSDPVTIPFDAPVAEAARRMELRGVKRLPVVDGSGRLMGIISRGDVISVFARPDEVIEDEVREDLLRRTLFLEPEAVEVKVKEGAVTIRGRLPTRSDALLLEELVRRSEGVVEVEMKVSWAEDDSA